MNFDLHIENIGKLTDAKIRIGRFTVFAGPNNTGKSFVSKFLYSIFLAINSKLVRQKIREYTGYFISIDNSLEHLLSSVKNLEAVSGLLLPLREKLIELDKIVSNAPFSSPMSIEKYLVDLGGEAKNIKEMLPDIRLSLEPFIVNERMMFLDEVEHHLNVLERLFSNATEFINSTIGEQLEEYLIANFQVAQISDLQRTKDMPSKFESESFGKFELENGEIDCAINRVSLSESQQFSNVIYLESPIYWKLKNALEHLRLDHRGLESLRLNSKGHRRERLSGVPGYFYDLMSALRYKYTGDIAFPKIYERLTGKDVINGKITMSELGELLFQENERSFPMSATATGVANLGMLALLIERKVLDENSVIFIDEPEAHLHPAWQVVMAEVLFDLAKGGVNVVIATHSADILKWLEVHVKKHPDDEKLVALNKFPLNGDATNEQDFSDKMASIKRELTKPFADLYVDGL